MQQIEQLIQQLAPLHRAVSSAGPGGVQLRGRRRSSWRGPFCPAAAAAAAAAAGGGWRRFGQVSEE